MENESIQQCIVCHEPLGELEISLNRAWHYECQKCQICNAEITSDRISDCIKRDITISHITCYDDRMAAEIRSRPVTVTQELLDYLNEWKLLKPDMHLSVQTNQQNVENGLPRTKFFHEMSDEEKYVFGKNMEAAAACISVILSQNKSKDRIRVELQERDKAKIKAAQDYRQEPEKAKLRKQPTVKELMKLGMTEIEADTLVKKEKAIAGLMKIGMSREDAITSLTTKSQSEQVN